MASLLERKLIVVTGKGGAGKSTIAGALGLIAAGRGLRTIIVEMGEQAHLAALYGRRRHPEKGEAEDRRRLDQGDEIELEPSLWSLSLDPDRALIEWMRSLGGGLPARVLASSSSFQYFAAAAPGAKELVSLVKLHELCAARDGRYDLVVLDAPATGHALAMLGSPATLTSIVRSGPLVQRARQVQEMLEDPLRTGFVAVARATEMAVSETVELEQELHRRLDRGLDSIVVNGVLPRRFTIAEMDRIEHDATAPATRSAARAARIVHDRSRAQQRQLARLRRRAGETGEARRVLTIPFVFAAALERIQLEEIAQRLDLS